MQKLFPVLSLWALVMQRLGFLLKLFQELGRGDNGENGRGEFNHDLLQEI
jgi:hypothetical protein